MAKRYSGPPPMRIDPAKRYAATFHTSRGDFTAELFAAQAPITVNNFVFLAREGFYDGLTFHRVVTGFVIQGGDPEGDGRGGPGYTFADELPDDGYPAGAVAMANAGPDTNGSQFFIVTGTAELPNVYSRFGRVTEGLDVAQQILGRPVAGDRLPHPLFRDTVGRRLPRLPARLGPLHQLARRPWVCVGVRARHRSLLLFRPACPPHDSGLSASPQSTSARRSVECRYWFG